jgi:hypothetical protein
MHVTANTRDGEENSMRAEKQDHDARSLEFKYASSRRKRKGENKRGAIDLCGDLGYIISS